MVSSTGRRRSLAFAALVAVPLVYVTVPVLTVVHPGFSWIEQPLSDLGVAGAPTAWAFNGTLVLFGALSVAFASVVARDSETTLERLGAALVGIGYVFAMLVGTFPTPHPLHDPATLFMYLFGIAGLYVRGTGAVLARDLRIGLATLWLGILSPWIWLAWLTVVGFDAGLAIPEYAAGLLVDAWLVLAAVRYLRESRS